jgi:hypothetical protein
MPCTCGLECPFFQFAKEYVERFEALDRKFPVERLSAADRAFVGRRVRAFGKRKGKIDQQAPATGEGV